MEEVEGSNPSRSTNFNSVRPADTCLFTGQRRSARTPALECNYAAAVQQSGICLNTSFRDLKKGTSYCKFAT